jgi:hypothetical protein
MPREPSINFFRAALENGSAFKKKWIGLELAKGWNGYWILALSKWDASSKSLELTSTP